MLHSNNSVLAMPATPSAASGEPSEGELLDQSGLWVVIAAYNEASRIGTVLEQLLQHVLHVVVVDDGSDDGTAGEARRYPIWVLEHACNLGQGAALQTGIRFALGQGADYVATFDADGQHHASDLPRMLSHLIRSRADFALGSRFLGRAEGLPVARKWVLKLGTVFTRLASGISLSDTHNGIRVMTRRGAESLHITMNRMEHASQILDQIAASGLTYREVPVTVRYTEASLRKGQRTAAAIRLGLKFLLEKAV